MRTFSWLIAPALCEHACLRKEGGPACSTGTSSTALGCVERLHYTSQLFRSEYLWENTAALLTVLTRQCRCATVRAFVPRNSACGQPMPLPHGTGSSSAFTTVYGCRCSRAVEGCDACHGAGSHIWRAQNRAVHTNQGHSCGW